MKRREEKRSKEKESWQLRQTSVQIFSGNGQLHQNARSSICNYGIQLIFCYAFESAFPLVFLGMVLDLMC